VKNILNPNLICVFIVLFFSVYVQAQHKKANSYQGQVESQRAEYVKEETVPEVKFRLLANFEYANVNPSALNENRTRTLWNGTTVTQGTFSAPMGFSVGAGYSIWNGFFGFEFGRVSEELASTTITATTTSVRDGFDLEHVSLTYDYVIPYTSEHSFETGASIGTALKFRFYNLLESPTASEVIYWQDNPILFKVRGAYNYHFSKHVRFKAALGYEMAASSNMNAAENHPTQTISQGQALRDASGQNVKVDFSGLRGTAGLVVAF
jgi:hypothetical protein